ncbi:MAG: hypothetical protein I3273_06560 [Candidatus Moeniiplasma glomeromycotorum]|nr:hypothetical protein [Candidatus Moeniiplasma glomeromycotorum]MCE8168214.1 hypothetical protein [Candidatus Moeniiplasma glomeromycotorum]MCE8169747.1 hypothetical protein [Candidatus Moeniiplasma glomeromycotorum]
MYAIIWSEKAKRSLNKLDQVRKKKVIDKVENDLAKDPYGRGDCLKGDLKG